MPEVENKPKNRVKNRSPQGHFEGQNSLPLSVLVTDHFPGLKADYPDLRNDLVETYFYSIPWFVFYFRHRELSDLYVKLYN